MPTQKEYNVSIQRTRKLFVKIYLLDFNFRQIGELSGVVLDGSTFSIDSTSDIRRTCSISLIPTDSSFDIKSGSKIWLDKYIKVYVGIEDIHTEEVVYTDMGIYMINNPSRVYEATNNTLTIQGVDLMAKLTSLRNGYFNDGVAYTVPMGSNVRNAIISVLQLGGFSKYVVEECPYTVQSDIKIANNGTLYDILKQLNSIVEQYQMYFDVEGVFHYNKIPSGKNEQIMVDDEVWEKVLINYSVDTPFDSIKNSIIVLGGTHDVSYYQDSVPLDENFIYNFTFEGITELYDGLIIGFTSLVDNSHLSRIKVNDFTAKYLRNEDGTTPTIEQGVYYVCQYVEVGDYYKFLGGVTPFAKVMETNPNSPFYVYGSVGEIPIVLQGEDYDNIFTDDLAEQRAEWELYTRCRINDSVNVTCVPIYWLDVNWIVSLTLPNKQGTEETNLYKITNISTTVGVGGTQTLTLTRYYPYYDF